jgi:hypothetical protein
MLNLPKKLHLKLSQDEFIVIYAIFSKLFEKTSDPNLEKILIKLDYSRGIKRNSTIIEHIKPEKEIKS